jgi:tRNA-splicing endonuclease subunit Sen2
MTSEEVTAKRRAERKQFKMDRAKAIAQAAAEAEAAFAEGRIITPALSGPNIPSGATWRPSKPSEVPVASAQETLEDTPIEDEEPLEDVEHLQLTLQEAFFLIWNFDCLTILDPRSV